MNRSSFIKALLLVFSLCVFVFFIPVEFLTLSVKETDLRTCAPASEILVDPATATVQEIYRYLRWTNSSSCILSHDYGGVLVKLKDLYTYDGQKAICVDAGVKPEPNKCIVYSFGINNEWSFDDALANYGCRVFAFDPSMNVGSHNRSNLIHFFNIGLSDRDVESDPVKGWKLRSLISIYEMLKPWHGNNAIIDYLKVDIEDGEWKAIPQMIKSGILDKVKQLGFEIHLFDLTTVEQHREKYAILRSLEDYGMVRFDSKGNPLSRNPVAFMPGGYARIAYEIAWYNPKYYQREFV